MIPIDPSAISKSTSENLNSQHQKDLVSGSSKKLDLQFPLFDQMFQKFKFPQGISVIIEFYYILQALFSCQWLISPFWDGLDSTSHNALEYICIIFLFHGRKPDFSYLSISAIVFSALFFIFIVFYVLQEVYYKVRHRFSQPLLIIFRSLCEIVPKLLVHPLAWFIGNSLKLFNETQQSILWAFIIVGVIYFVFFLVFHSIYISLNSYSAYYVPNPWLIRNSFLMNLSFNISPVLCLASVLLSIYINWLVLFCQIISLIVFLFIFIQAILSYPCATVTGNAFFLGWSLTAVISDFYMTIFYFVKIPFFIPLILAVCFFIASIFLFTFLNKKTKLKIKGHLTKDTSVNLSEDEISQQFQDLGLSNHKYKAILYLYIGVEYNSDYLLDWSLLRFITHWYDDVQVLLTCAQVLIFFPGEIRQLNSLLSTILKQRGFSFSQRFLIYQLFRIKTLRASSQSSESTLRLNELKTHSAEIETYITSFWGLKKSSLGYFEQLSKQIRRINGLWQEAILDYPNSNKFSDEYSKFLVEDATNFEKALVQKQRAELIDLGTNFSIDRAFRFFVAAFPHYLRSHIVDFKGNMIKTSNGTRSSVEDRSNSTNSTGDIEIDAELENTLGKALIKDHKIRLVLDRSLMGITTKGESGMNYTILIIFIVGIVASIAVFLALKSVFQERGQSMYRLKYIADLQFFFDLTSLCVIYDFSVSTGRFTDATNLLQNVIDEDRLERTDLDPYIIIPPGNTTSNMVMYYQSFSRTCVGTLFKSIADLAATGVNVYATATELINYNRESFVCHRWPALTADGKVNLTIFPPEMSTLQSVIISGYFLQSEMAGSWGAGEVNDGQFITQTEDFCELYQNWKGVIEGCNSLFTTFSSQQVDKGNSLQQIILIVLVVVPLSVFFLTLIPQIICLIKFKNEINKIGKILLNFDQNIKKDCIHRISYSSEDEKESREIKSNYSIITVLFVFLLSFCLAIALIIFGMLLECYNSNQNISMFNQWEALAANRIVKAVEFLHDLLFAVILSDPLHETFLSLGSLINRTYSEIDELELNNLEFMQGNKQVQSSGGFDAELDKINIVSPCSNYQGPYPIHNVYKCSSTNDMLITVQNLGRSILDNITRFNGNLGEDTIIHSFHLSASHLWSNLRASLDRIVALGEISYQNLLLNMGILMAVAIVLTLVSVFMAIYIKLEMNQCLQSCFVLIKHVPPQVLVNSNELMEILLNRTNTSSDSGSCIEEAILKKARDGLMYTSLTGVVEMANPAISQVLGYTPEQILGQPFSNFFVHEDSQKIESQLELMKSGQSSEVYDDHVKCFTDRETEVPCHLTLLGIKSKGKHSIDSFVFIITNETILLQQQKEAEEAKAKSEHLLYQILPRDIVIRLNRGEKDISFSVPSASIIFIDIVRFSDYAANLTPEQIMGNLSTIFASFDTLIVKYPLLYKIKLIGDVYMAAAGLFSPDEPPSSHAEQTIRFGLDVITELEEINVKLNSNLAVRVGVNTGGPLIAGVLGTDKPAFDIIGDPINVASRLQSTDVPGRIQIAQATYELINNLDFEIDERGEVFLKGKGKTKAYFVRTFNTFFSHLSSKELT